MGILYHDDVKKFMYHSSRKSVCKGLFESLIMVVGVWCVAFKSVLNSGMLYLY